MDELTTIGAMRTWSRAQRAAGRTIAFVPTMGALHEGHLSLVRQARAAADRVVVSIYVNPTQFDNPDDLAKYPQTLAEDQAKLAAAGVDAVFLPATEQMYPNGYCTFIEIVGPLTDKLCAIARPGHFRGVATVVIKLFHAVEPDVAVFGQKDLQQVMIVNRMVNDLDLPIRVLVGPTVREADGLAMSSRNRRLDAGMRERALSLPRGLERARLAYGQGLSDAMKLCEAVYDECLQHEGVEVDYVEVVSLKGFTTAETADDACVLAAAILVDGVRLIDHVALAGTVLPVPLDD